MTPCEKAHRASDLLWPGITAFEQLDGLDADVSVVNDGLVLDVTGPNGRVSFQLASAAEIESGAFKEQFRPRVEAAVRGVM